MPNSKLYTELKEIIESKLSGLSATGKFLARLEKGILTIQENQQSHFCAYFAAIDPGTQEIFVGDHKKAGLWLVNGGHIDEDENLQETLKREIDEEWGLNFDDLIVSEPLFLTISEIYNPEKQPCREHFDIWHFVSVDKNAFSPDQEKLAKEFHETRWVRLEEARKLTKGNAQHNAAFDFVENNLFKK